MRGQKWREEDKKMERKGGRSRFIRCRYTHLQEIPTDLRNHNNTQQEITAGPEQLLLINKTCYRNKPTLLQTVNLSSEIFN